jgi:DNA repair photolyase
MFYADYKTILSNNNGMNLYRGCSHGCIYCDSRSVCYQINHDFEEIEVKRNAAEILEKQLLRRRKPCMISTGAMSDSYIPPESELKVTRKCIEIIEKHGFGLTIQTKSNRILRDLDLFKKINRNSKCVVQMTLTTYDEDLCRIIEPNVSTTLERFKVLEIMRNEGIPTVVWLDPILPFINDNQENLLGILDYCIKAKVTGIICFAIGMTLREGNREYFYKKLDEFFPGIKKRYIETFGLSYECHSPENTQLMKIFREICQKHNILYEINDVFNYLHTFKTSNEQLSLF